MVPEQFVLDSESESKHNLGIDNEPVSGITAPRLNHMSRHGLRQVNLKNLVIL